MVTTSPSDALDRGRVRALPMFAGTSDADLDSVLQRMHVVTADAGEAVVVEGDPSDYAYVILAGSTTVTRAGDELASLGPGDLFGETAMVAGGTRTATVRATTPVELLRLDAQSVAETTGTQTIAWNMLQSLLERIRRDDDRGSDAVPASTETIAHTPSPLPTAGVGGDNATGEYLRVAERVVVSPKVGVFRPCEPADRVPLGELLAAGQVIGFVDVLGQHSEVRSPFAGFFMGMLALDGERVRAGQPIAWLRTL